MRLGVKSFVLLGLIDQLGEATAWTRPLERLDLKGPIRPIAFAEGGDPPDFLDMAPFEERMTFREEQRARGRPMRGTHKGTPT
jgi:hypothetical protein